MALKITRAVFALLAIGLVGLAAVRVTSDVKGEKGYDCGPGWTTEYDGSCDAALTSRQVEVAVEAVLAVGVVLISRRHLTDPRDGAAAL